MISSNIHSRKHKGLRQWPLHLMILPGIVVLLIYNYIPMAGIVIAFERFTPAKGIFGSKWVGLDNFEYIFSMPDFGTVVWNTFFIAIMKIITELVCPITLALMLNEIRSTKFKRGIQTAVYLPHFLSWVILGGILVDILSPSDGIINKIIIALGGEPIFFLGDSAIFPYTVIVTNIWKEVGYKTIIYLAALTGIDLSLYEAAIVDGAGRWKQTLHVTIPGILSTIVLMVTLSLGNVLNAGFDQIFNLYSPQVYSTGDILDTMVYRLGLEDMQYGPATAVGLFKSLISFTMITLSYTLARRYADYKLF